MRWSGRRESANVEDRRGMPVKGIAAGGGGLLLLVVVIISLLTGKDPTPLLQQAQQQGGAAGAGQTQPIDPAQEPLRQFVSVVLADTEDVWDALMPRDLGRSYQQPKLVLFSGQVQSACGLAPSFAGPHTPSPAPLCLEPAEHA